MAESEGQSVLLTEGSFVQEDEKTSQNPVESAPLEKGSETPIPVRDSARSSPVEQSETVRPVTAPEAEASVRESLQEVEKSVRDTAATTGGLLLRNDDAGQEEDIGSVEPKESLDFDLDLGRETCDKLEKELLFESERGSYGDDDTEYIAPPGDPYMRAINYMEKHKVMQIFQKLTAEIVYHRPHDPLEHMLSELQKMKQERDASINAVIAASSGV